jgi:hypothetical protein
MTDLDGLLKMDRNTPPMKRNLRTYWRARMKAHPEVLKSALSYCIRILTGESENLHASGFYPSIDTWTRIKVLTRIMRKRGIE